MPETKTPAIDSDRTPPAILMPLPDRDFDPTEAAIPWKECVSRGWKVDFSTVNGTVAQADQYKLNGPLPGLLSAGTKAREAYQQMTQEPAYRHPVPYAGIDPNNYKALLLPGGDTPNMRPYLESAVLQSKVLQFWQEGKLVGAICHGILVLARTIDPRTGWSVLYGRKVTALPGSLDRFGYLLATRLLKRDYLMYSCCVAEEVSACLERPGDFSRGPGLLAPYVVTDGNLVTSRWYMDAELFAGRFAGELERRMDAERETA